MLYFRLFIQGLFLLATLATTSGFIWPCFALCSDQSSIQEDYTSQRNKCRQYAQLKIDAGLAGNTGGEETNRSAQLVALFSECMGKNGWVVPSGKEEGKNEGILTAAPVAPTTPFSETVRQQYAAPPQHVLVPPPSESSPVFAKPSAAEIATEDKEFLKRSGECAFARQAASASANSAAVARACDLECKERLRAAPEAPWPAACPPKGTIIIDNGFSTK